MISLCMLYKYKIAKRTCCMYRKTFVLLSEWERGRVAMATSSIYTSVKVKNESDSKRLVSALEHAVGKKAKEVVFSRHVEVIKGEKVKDLFE